MRNNTCYLLLFFAMCLFMACSLSTKYFKLLTLSNDRYSQSILLFESTYSLLEKIKFRFIFVYLKKKPIFFVVSIKFLIFF